MGAYVSRAANVLPFGHSSPRLTREQIYLVDKYLADFRFHEASTPAHLQVAAAHWNRVFTDIGSNRSTTRASTSSIATGGRQAASKASVATTSGSRIGVLYDTFYDYLGKHSPELQPIFRSSMHVRSKVLLHISAGMRRILSHEFAIDKVLELTRTHIRFGVKLEHFNALGKALLYAMSVASEDQWNAETEDAWRRMFAHCSAILMIEHRKAVERNGIAKIKQREKHQHEQVDVAIGPEAQDVFSVH